MNILYVGYWSANDGLSQSTINPHLKILAESKEVEKLIYLSIERSQEQAFSIPTDNKVTHSPYYSGLGFFSKLKDFTFLPWKLARLIKSERIDVVIARSSPAGGVVYLATRFRKVPFYVESFEPHAEYMLEARIWRKSGISYLLESWLEKKQLEYGFGIFPVTNAFQKELIEKYPNQWIESAPCGAHITDFQFSETERKRIRSGEGIPDNAIVGIYVGKIGGNYLEKEAFRLFEQCYRNISQFFLILLTPQDRNHLRTSLFAQGINHDFLIKSVSHKEVASYLSAADFGFALYKPGLSKKAISPIKVGEYWANGLPIFITQGIGDEDVILNEHPYAGSKFNPANADFVGNIRDILLKLGNRSKVKQLASTYRSFQAISRIYAEIINKFSN